jgi:hypothetical protein
MNKTKKRQAYLTRPVHRVNLTLPFIRTDAYEIYYTIPPAQTRQPSTVRPVSRQKPVFDIASTIKQNNQSANNRPQARMKHLTGPVLVNLIVEMPTMPTDTSSTVADSISNALINSGYSGQTLRDIPSIVKHNKIQVIKDDGDRSQTSSSDRMLLESVGSFEEPFLTKTKSGMWANVHHPQLSTLKVLHTRSKEKSAFSRYDSPTRTLNTSSIGNLSQASIISTNDRLYEKVEQLTKSYFPSIQQLRHIHPCPELINNRMHLHREEKRDFVPVLYRPRVAR